MFLINKSLWFHPPNQHVSKNSEIAVVDIFNCWKKNNDQCLHQSYTISSYLSIHIKNIWNNWKDKIKNCHSSNKPSATPHGYWRPLVLRPPTSSTVLLPTTANGTRLCEVLICCDISDCSISSTSMNRLNNSRLNIPSLYKITFWLSGCKQLVVFALFE